MVYCFLNLSIGLIDGLPDSMKKITKTRIEGSIGKYYDRYLVHKNQRNCLFVPIKSLAFNHKEIDKNQTSFNLFKNNIIDIDTYPIQLKNIEETNFTNYNLDQSKTIFNYGYQIGQLFDSKIKSQKADLSLFLINNLNILINILIGICLLIMFNFLLSINWNKIIFNRLISSFIPKLIFGLSLFIYKLFYDSIDFIIKSKFKLSFSKLDQLPLMSIIFLSIFYNQIKLSPSLIIYLLKLLSSTIYNLIRSLLCFIFNQLKLLLSFIFKRESFNNYEKKRSTRIILIFLSLFIFINLNILRSSIKTDTVIIKTDEFIDGYDKLNKTNKFLTFNNDESDLFENSPQTSFFHRFYKRKLNEKKVLKLKEFMGIYLSKKENIDTFNKNGLRSYFFFMKKGMILMDFYILLKKIKKNDNQFIFMNSKNYFESIHCHLIRKNLDLNRKKLLNKRITISFENGIYSTYYHQMENLIRSSIIRIHKIKIFESVDTFQKEYLITSNLEFDNLKITFYCYLLFCLSFLILFSLNLLFLLFSI